MKKKIVVIGNGMAGAKVVEEILKRSRDQFEIIMFGAESYGNYNRILLSNIVNQSQKSSEIIMNPLNWYEENNICLHRGVKVTRIDRKKKKVFGKKMKPGVPAYENFAGDSEESIEEVYDFLIMATGSRPFVPSIDGFGTKGTFLFRTIDDSIQIAEYAKKCQKAVVIGGGLLGLEAARGLMTHNLDVMIVEAAPQLMPAQLDLESSQLLKNSMESMGIHMNLGMITTGIVTKENCVSGIKFKDGSSHQTDMVVLSAGIRPITELAVECGLKVNKGIVCSDQMKTSDKSIFSLGECIEHRGVLYGLVEPIWEQARVIADIITECGADALYEGTKIGTRLKVMGVDLVSIGEKNPSSPDDEVIIYRDPKRGVYKKLIVRDEKIHGAILLGETESADQLMRLFKNDGDVLENRWEMLNGAVDSRTLIDVVDLPDNAQVCNCNGVCKKNIVDAIVNKKLTSVSAIGEETKAGKGCGSCKGLISQIIEATVGKVSNDPSEHYYVQGIPLEKSQLIRAIKNQNLKSVSSLFEAFAEGKEDLGSKPGLASLLKTIWAEEYEDERDARFINDRVHANIQKDGTFSVVPRIYGGVTSPEDLIRISQAALKYKVKMVKFTGGQRIVLFGVKKEDLPKIWKDIGLPSGHAYAKSFRTCKSCVGTDYCRVGVGDSIALAQNLEHRFQGIETPHKFKMATAGCPRNCSEAYIKDLGVVAIEGGKWEIYIGGGAGSVIRKGDLLCIVDSHYDVIKYASRFMEYYRQHAKYLERTNGFVERIGLEVLKAILVDDSLGICAQLEKRMQKSVEAFVDPWEEAEVPAYKNQFRGAQYVEVIDEVNR